MRSSHVPRAQTVAAFLICPDSIRPYCKNQFGQNHYTCIAAKQVVIVPVRTVPVQDDCDLATREVVPSRWAKARNSRARVWPRGVVDPPAVSLADQLDGVTGAGGGDGGQ